MQVRDITNPAQELQKLYKLNRVIRFASLAYLFLRRHFRIDERDLYMRLIQNQLCGIKPIDKIILVDIICASFLIIVQIPNLLIILMQESIDHNSLIPFNPQYFIILAGVLYRFHENCHKHI